MRIPVATYRIQLNQKFTFKDVKKIVRFLSELGISDLYASPIFKSRKGSMHGYDIVDPNQINPEMGTTEEFSSLFDELKIHNLGWLQDIVPNHMAFNRENRMLMDVLENGESSEYFRYFDIEWDHPYEILKGKLLAPFLGKFYGEALETGEISLSYEEDGFSANYYDLKFPLKIETYVKLLTHKFPSLRKTLGRDNPDYIKFIGMLYTLKNLSPKEDIKERYEQIKFAKKMLWELYNQKSDIKIFIDENIKTFNGEKGNPESFNLLDGLLSEQMFRISFWKVGSEEINYRRFFNINELISVRVEDESVFERTHSLIFKLIAEGKITGLRIDHIDGLYDPSLYIKMLRSKLGGIYIVAEKILDFDEYLPETLQVHGTTGYDFVNYVNNIFCCSENEAKFDRIYEHFIGTRIPYNELVFSKKRLIIGKHMAGNIDNLAHLLKKISGRDRYGSDITLYSLRRALVDILAWFPVYRTYINNEKITEADSKYIKGTIEKAVKNNPELLNEINFVGKFLLLKFPGYINEEEKKQWLHFVMRFQQFTGPIIAKGFEDTTLYIYNRLISLNEVGSKPYRFGISVNDFHNFNTKRVHFFPHTMNATSTHDIKRGEDVRARINVLSELPGEWKDALKKWSKLNNDKKQNVSGVIIPDANDEYLIYQTLLGSYPFSEDEHSAYTERIKNYTIKAVREAKVHTAWLKPDTDYENACVSFVEGIMGKSDDNKFLKEFLTFQKKIAHYGIFNSLSQAIIKMTSPGVPDFYQGTELWDLFLVDPDNRGLVDFNKRTELLREIKDKGQKNIPEFIKELIDKKEDGRIKLFL
ncbi:MAG: malto-oligosyltrehalose synthase, partial [Elusimicrobia bacterium A5]